MTVYYVVNTLSGEKIAVHSLQEGMIMTAGKSDLILEDYKGNRIQLLKE
jgi:hypothetical protein